MKVIKLDTQETFLAVKNEDGTYTVNNETLSAKDMGTKYKRAEPAAKPASAKSSGQGIKATEPIVNGTPEALMALFEAVSKAQSEMAVGTKNVEGYSYTYMDMAQVIEISKKPLADNNLAVMQFPSTYIVDGSLLVRITTMISHKDGAYITSHFDSVVKESKKQALIQTIGSLCTYQARYARNNILGISADKDEDGNDTK